MPKSNKNWKELKVGDIVSSYFRGTWKILEISYEGRDTSPLVTILKLAHYSGKPPNRRIVEECDISWCHLEPELRLQWLKMNNCDLNMA